MLTNKLNYINNKFLKVVLKKNQGNCRLHHTCKIVQAAKYMHLAYYTVLTNSFKNLYLGRFQFHVWTPDWNSSCY